MPRKGGDPSEECLGDLADPSQPPRKSQTSTSNLTPARQRDLKGSLLAMGFPPVPLALVGGPTEPSLHVEHVGEEAPGRGLAALPAAAPEREIALPIEGLAHGLLQLPLPHGLPGENRDRESVQSLENRLEELQESREGSHQSCGDPAHLQLLKGLPWSLDPAPRNSSWEGAISTWMLINKMH